MNWHYASLSDYPQTANPCLSEPNIDKQDILLLKAQLDAMRGYAGILVARLYYHDIEID